MAITQSQLTLELNAANAAKTLMDNEWGPGANVQNATGYAVLSWLTEIQKCDPSAYITRNATTGVANTLSYDPNKTKSTTCNNRVIALNTALAKYNLLQSDYYTKQTTYTNDLNNYNTQGNAIVSNSKGISQEAITVLIIVVVIGVIIGGYFFLKKKNVIK